MLCSPHLRAEQDNLLRLELLASLWVAAIKVCSSTIGKPPESWPPILGHQFSTVVSLVHWLFHPHGGNGRRTSHHPFDDRSRMQSPLRGPHASGKDARPTRMTMRSKTPPWPVARFPASPGMTWNLIHPLSDTPYFCSPSCWHGEGWHMIGSNQEGVRTSEETARRTY